MKSNPFNRIFSITLALVTFGFLAADSAHAAWTVTQLTDNSYDDSVPQIYALNVVWQGYDGNDYEIFNYDGTDTTQLTDNSYDDVDPDISGACVTWQGRKDGSDYEIFLAIPEPATLGLLLIGSLALLRRRSR